mgnify:CR=1 FL=1
MEPTEITKMELLRLAKLEKKLAKHNCPVRLNIYKYAELKKENNNSLI